MTLKLRSPCLLLTTGWVLAIAVVAQSAPARQKAAPKPSAATVQSAAAADQGQILYSFENPSDLALAEATNASTSLEKRGATNGAEALRIDFSPSDWPNVKWTTPQPWDWSSRGLALDITNPSGQAQEFCVRVDDDAAANGWDHSRTGTGTIGAGQTASFFMDIGADPMAHGMRGLPPKQGFSALGSVGSATAFDLHHVVALEIFLDHPVTERSLILGNIRLLPSSDAELGDIVDRFGQYSQADWPGKLHDAAEFATRRQAEELDLRAHPALPDRDRFGGWAAGPKLTSSGFFRVEKYAGKWSFVDPDGHLFFSLGVDSMQPGQATLVSGRESMFSVLPAQDELLARHVGHDSNILQGPTKSGETVDFEAANLERKYGGDYRSSWRTMALARLTGWGFNTIGNWPAADLYGNGQVPYVVTVWPGSKHAHLSSGNDFWRAMDDPFDPRFAVDVANAVKPFADKYKDDPYCLGYFVGNEESWGGGASPQAHFGLALGALKADAADSPAKAAMIAQLKAKYTDIAALNASWGTSIASWDALDEPFSPTSPYSAAVQADFSAFLTLHALTYFRTVRDEIRKVDPNHLYLGCRFAACTPEAVQAAAEMADVISFNVYQHQLRSSDLPALAGIDHPCIVGEFHFGALDRGMFHAGLVPTSSQRERAACYTEYVRSVVDAPLFIGCHWFQYVDEPLTGRPLDGESYNCGLVDCTDTPYPEMVDAARRVDAEVYLRRFGKAG